MTFEVILKNGDTAEADTPQGIGLAAQSLVTEGLNAGTLQDSSVTVARVEVPGQFWTRVAVGIQPCEVQEAAQRVLDGVPANDRGWL